MTAVSGGVVAGGSRACAQGPLAVGAVRLVDVVGCTFCGRGPRHGCVSSSGDLLGEAHQARRMAALAVLNALEATQRYLVWVCGGCDHCDPPDGVERVLMPCTHRSPSTDGAWVLKLADLRGILGGS